MAHGFFRELKQYTLPDIADALGAGIEETGRLVGILKKYGVIKAVKKSRPAFSELSNQDLAITDVEIYRTDVRYVFDFVGVVMLGGFLWKCYPKYIRSTNEPVEQLKQALKVIRKYHDRSQPLYLHYGGEGEAYNRLAVSLYLLEDYGRYGLYANQQEVVEINGDGEILWDRTIHETFAYLQNGRPYYLTLKTQNKTDNETDYFRRLHQCVLMQCTRELKQTGVLELLDLDEIRLPAQPLAEFGDVDTILYRLGQEMRVQFATRKQDLLKTMYAYIAHMDTKEQDVGVGLYGTNCFQMIWEKVCAQVFGNVLHWPLGRLPRGVCSQYRTRQNQTLGSVIGQPVWHRNHPPLEDGETATFRPDLVCIYPYNGEYCFGIFDAKYYCINFKQEPSGNRVTGQPGIGDVAKQYLYQLAFADFIAEQGYRYVQNLFLCPQEESDPDFGYVELEMLHRIGDVTLENIAVVKLCAAEMFGYYLANAQIETFSDYLPCPVENPEWRKKETNA